MAPIVNKLCIVTLLLSCICVCVCKGQKSNGCSIQIIVDPFLQEHLKETFTQKRPSEMDVRRKIVFFVGQHIRFVNSVLEKYNFLPSGDPIRIFPKKIKILDFNNCLYQGINYCQRDTDLLQTHSSVDQAQFCLSFVFTYQDLNEGYLGMAWTASSKQADEGGLCSEFASKTSSTLEDINDDEWELEASLEDKKSKIQIKQSRNTGLVSFKYNGVQVPDFVSKLAFLHEIGHSLGSPHDYPSNCIHSETGYFVMHQMGGLNGFLDNNYQFSDCSVKNISLTMAALKTLDRNCLQPVPASVCGNGLVEAWEECDCGSDEAECAMDKCCFPADHPDKPCQRRPKALCSLSEGACCREDCQLLKKSDGFECSEETECAFKAACDGTSTSCPTPRPKANTNTCRQGTMMCQSGECSQSICGKFNMIACRTTSENPCELHCQTPRRPDTCSPSSQKAPLFTEAVYQPVNTFCHITDYVTNDTILGYCSSSNTCQTFLDQSANLGSSSWIVGLIIFLVVYAIIMVLGIWIYCRYCKGSCRQSLNRNHDVLTES